MHILRWITGTPIAALVTAALFVMMAAMIRPPVDGWTTPKPRNPIEITQKIIETPIPRPRLVEPVKEKQPPIEIQNTTAGEKPTLQYEVPNHTPDNTNPGDGAGIIVAPLIRVAPAYPERCRARGAEGSVLVQFDVAADGSVASPMIIESSDSCFDRTVLKAVSGWKYPPASRNGKAVPRYGLIERFSFQFEAE